MVDERTSGSLKPPIDYDGTENLTTKNKIRNRRSAHATIAVVDNDRFTSLCTLDIRPVMKDSTIHPATVHQWIFDAIKTIDDSTVIITSDNTSVTNSKYIPSGKGYEQMFPAIRTDAVTKWIYLSFKLESTHTLTQLKFGSKHDDTTGIFDTLHDNLVFIKLNKFQSQIEANIGFFLEINPKLTLRKVLKKKIDEICTWLDLDNDDMKALSNIFQVILFPAYDMHHKAFGSGIWTEKITTSVYEIRTSPENTHILKNILCKASQPVNHPIVQFILCAIQGITNSDIKKTII